ncbi:hypothetical protein CK203_047534 [Vitis vinifera]|uniref:Uncharacterized protein n=1 Tax=Vitis vinifera TaxID=29760 RepID=A0A438GWX6_VITVI|nr:hypothetical protein CK203_047534 [Vitis vinifera]
MSIHVVEAQEEEYLMEKEVKTVITLSGKEVDLPTCKLEHKVESETEKEKREEIKGKKKGKSFWMIKIKRNCKEIEKKNRSKIGAKSESNGPKTGEKQGKNRGLRDFATSAKLKFCWAKPVRSNWPLCENFRSCETHFGTRVPLRSTGASVSQLRNHCEVKKADFATKVPFRRGFRGCESTFGHSSAISQHRYFAAAKPLLAHECHFAAQWPHFAAAKAAANHQSMKSSISQRKLHSAGYLAAAKPILAHECHFAAQEHLFRSCETHCEVVKPDFAPKAPFRRGFRGWRKHFWHTSAIPQHSDSHFAAAKWLRNGCEIPKCEKSQFHSRTPFRQLLDTFRSFPEVQIMHAISHLKAWEVTSPQLQTVLDLDLKRKSYGCLKKTVQTMSGNLAPQFATVGHILKHFLELKLCI